MGQVPSVRLYLLAGQANLQYFDTEEYLRPLLEAAYPTDKIVISKYTPFQAEIRHWDADYPKNNLNWSYEAGDFFDPMMDQVSKDLNGHQVNYASLVWLQGQSDAQMSLQDYYEESLTNVINKIGDHFKPVQLQTMPTVISRINDWYCPHCDYAWCTVRNAQVEVAEAWPAGGWIDMDEMNNYELDDDIILNNYYETVEGYKQYGQELAAKLIQLQCDQGSECQPRGKIHTEQDTCVAYFTHAPQDPQSEEVEEPEVDHTEIIPPEDHLQPQNPFDNETEEYHEGKIDKAEKVIEDKVSDVVHDITVVDDKIESVVDVGKQVVEKEVEVAERVAREVEENASNAPVVMPERYWSMVYGLVTAGSTALGMNIWWHYPGKIMMYCKQHNLSDKLCKDLDDLRPIKQWTEFSVFQSAFYGMGTALWLANLLMDNQGGPLHIWFYNYYLATGPIGFFLSAFMGTTAFGSYRRCTKEKAQDDVYCLHGELATVDNDYLKEDPNRERFFAQIIGMAHLQAIAVFMSYYQITLRYKDATQKW